MSTREPQNQRVTMTADEAAAYLGLHPNKVRQMLASGELPGKKAGRKWIVPVARLDAWLDN